MKTQRVHLKNVLAGALLFALCAAPARAGVSLLYYVGYGLYPYGAADVATTAPGTGLLANNGSGRALVQLIYAGPDNTIGDGVYVMDPSNAANGYVEGDDVVWQSTVIETGVNGVDEWGFSNTPFAYTNLAWATACFVYVRVFQDDSPQTGEAFYDTPLVAVDTTSIMGGVFGQSFTIDAGPTSGVALDQTGPLEPNPWPGREPIIQPGGFDPETATFGLGLPMGYLLGGVYGADTILPGGEWNWQPLAEGTNYVVDGAFITIQTTGESIPAQQMIRIGLIPLP
jgi:hypothetical protein